MQADLVVLNGRVITLDPARPRAEAVAVGGGRVLLVGGQAEVRGLIGARTEVVDAGGGVVVPGFHDAHLHVLRYARAGAYLACEEVSSLGELRRALRQRAAELPRDAWLRASGYDESRLAERRHPDRHDLDAAVAEHPVRLQHRSLHLDVLNSLALRRAGLTDSPAREVERDPRTGEPTGRVYHGAELLLHARLPRPSQAELAADVRRASQRLLAWGVTSIQDATATNGPSEWQLLQRLVDQGDLRQRVFVMVGPKHLTDVLETRKSSSARLRLSHVKLMIDERTSDPGELAAQVRAARQVKRPVAIHAVSEGEVAMALAAVRDAERNQARAPDRIEHAGVIPDDWLVELRAARVMVVGQPALVYERGDVYRAEYPPELHGWLHRAGSLIRAGVGYAASSDAPVTPASPSLGLFAARSRLTRGGAVLGPAEALSADQALAAFTLGPARAVGLAAQLGRIRSGALADLVVLEPDAPADVLVGERANEQLNGNSAPAAPNVRLTIVEGRVAWQQL